MIISDLFEDTPIILVEDGKYYELEKIGYSIDGITDLPSGVFVRKGSRIYKKDLDEYL